MLRTIATCAALAVGLATTPTLAHGILPPEIAARIPPRLAGALSRLRSLTEIERGRLLFERATFGGNGRTCASCHPRSENFTLTVPFIASRPSSDPLFVFERVPGLATLENGPALRGRALITENVDGFKNVDGSEIPGVLRSVPHTLGLSQSTNPQTGVPAGALGWSGDGAPRDGALRNFAVGAVVQHMPKSLNRVEGTDFRLPTASELDALEAFQLSLGRSTTPIVNPTSQGALKFVDKDVTAGQTLFHGMPSQQGVRNCSFCHNGGGALNPNGQNDQRATGAERSPRAPACTFPVAPGDGGFGPTPVITADRSTFCTNGATGGVVFRGDLSFSVPSTIEAADTAPFFHNNSADTLEDVVDFYRSAVFSRSISGANNAFVINDTQRNQLAAFMRALNVLENIRDATASIDSLPATRVLARPRIINDAQQQVRDAIRVLGEGNIQPYRTTALPALQQASLKLLARRTAAARADLEVARGLIAN
jgi:hypothetical protein